MQNNDKGTKIFHCSKTDAQWGADLRRGDTGNELMRRGWLGGLMLLGSRRCLRGPGPGWCGTPAFLPPPAPAPPFASEASSPCLSPDRTYLQAGLLQSRAKERVPKPETGYIPENEATTPARENNNNKPINYRCLQFCQNRDSQVVPAVLQSELHVSWMRDPELKVTNLGPRSLALKWGNQ